MDEKEAGGLGCLVVFGLCLIIGACIGNKEPSVQDRKEAEKQQIEREARDRLEQERQEIRDVVHELQVQEEMKRQRGYK